MMGIKKLFFQIVAILTVTSLLVIVMNSMQIQWNASQELQYLQKQYLNATYDIYKNEIIGDVLIGKKSIVLSLLNEITRNRGVGAVLTYNNTTVDTGKPASHSHMLSYRLNLGNQKFANLKLYHLKNFQVFNYVSALLIPLLLQALILCFGFLWLLRRIKLRLISPLNALVTNATAGNIDMFSLHAHAVDELEQLCSTLKKMSIEIRQKAQYEAESIVAKQVAHDIRSPLASLNLLLSYVTALPEKQRILMRSSIQRITDIANVFQNRAKKMMLLLEPETQQENIMISSLIETLITEKRMQLGLITHIHIDVDLEKSYGVFSTINANEFKRAISNLLNNSIEACDAQLHHIMVTVAQKNSQVIITIQDDGKGIPKQLLDKIGVHGFSYGKENIKSSGGGLGVYHALKTIHAFGGELFIRSTVNVGTCINIVLPKSDAPAWFVKEVNLSDAKSIIILDDDPSIHHLWNDRLDKYKRENIRIIHFSLAKEFQSFIRAKKINCIDDAVFLVDYELVGQNTTGLEIIEECGIGRCAFLVTSHHDDIHIQEKAVSLGAGIIPKGIAPYVPIIKL